MNKTSKSTQALLTSLHELKAALEAPVCSAETKDAPRLNRGEVQGSLFDDPSPASQNHPTNKKKRPRTQNHHSAKFTLEQDDATAVIDELVEEFLPKLEAALRSKLEQQLKGNK